MTNPKAIRIIFINENISKKTILPFLHKALTNRAIKVKIILEPIDTMNQKYQEAMDEQCALVLVETSIFCSPAAATGSEDKKDAKYTDDC